MTTRGYYIKQIRNKTYHFGRDPEKAVERYEKLRRELNAETPAAVDAYETRGEADPVESRFGAVKEYV